MSVVGQLGALARALGCRWRGLRREGGGSKTQVVRAEGMSCKRRTWYCRHLREILGVLRAVCWDGERCGEERYLLVVSSRNWWLYIM